MLPWVCCGMIWNSMQFHAIPWKLSRVHRDASWVFRMYHEYSCCIMGMNNASWIVVFISHRRRRLWAELLLNEEWSKYGLIIQDFHYLVMPRLGYHEFVVVWSELPCSSMQFPEIYYEYIVRHPEYSWCIMSSLAASWAFRMHHEYSCFAWKS